MLRLARVGSAPAVGGAWLCWDVTMHRDGTSAEGGGRDSRMVAARQHSSAFPGQGRGASSMRDRVGCEGEVSGGGQEEEGWRG